MVECDEAPRALGPPARLLAAAEVASMRAELIDAGLLLPDDGVRRLKRRILSLGALLALLGVVRIVAGVVAGAAIGWLALMVVAVVAATIWLAGRAPRTTAEGAAKLARWRDAHDDLRRNPVGGECALAAALFGGAALWLAAPEIASALGVEREGAPSSGGGGGGGCGSGCGGCGGCGG